MSDDDAEVTWPFDRAGMQAAISAGRVAWSEHALVRALERQLEPDAVVAALVGATCIEAYPTRRALPTALLLTPRHVPPLHIVVAFDAAAATLLIVTAYEPSAEAFEPDLRTRRR